MTTELTSTAPPPSGTPARRGLPRWFTTLFLTDMWERFSFYGMQAILFLYAAAPAEKGGLGLPAGTAVALYGAYLASVFLAAIPGGWLGDRVLGSRKATLLGAIVIASGHYAMAVPTRATSFLGLALIAAGTGLLKPNMTVLFNGFYPRSDRRGREAAFSIFYMSIQISAMVAPLIVGFLGEHVNWHLGFGAAAIGMTFGVGQYIVGSRHFKDVGLTPAQPLDLEERRRSLRKAATWSAVALVLLAAGIVADPRIVEHVTMVLGLTAIVCTYTMLRTLTRHPSVTSEEAERVRAFIWLFAASALFWAIYTQAGSVMSLFAKESTDREILGFLVPASYFQSLHPLFIFAAAPLFARLWLRLGPWATVTAKFAFGLVLVGLSYAGMGAAAALADGQTLVSPLWLAAAYLLQSCGELALAPVGLSLTAEVAPRSFPGRVVSLWWLSVALGAGLGGQVGRLITVSSPEMYYLGFGGVAVAAAAVLVLVRHRIGRVLPEPGDSRTRSSFLPSTPIKEQT